MIKSHIRTIVLIFIAIILTFSVYNYITDFNYTIEQIENNKSGTYEYICKVCEFPYGNDKYTNVYADIIDTNHPVNFKDYKVLFKVPSATNNNPEYGDTIKFKGIIQPANTSNNYGNFDYRKYLMSKNTVGICYIDNIEHISQGNGADTALYNFQRKINSNTEIYFKGENLALIKSMLTGDRQDIDDDLRSDFQTSGIYHIVAVSGLHTGIFISLFAYLLALLPMKSRFKNMISKLGAVLISVLLLMFTGYGISITRVIFMSVIMAICVMAKRQYSVIASIIAAAIVIVLLTPYNLFSQSFQLSFVSTFGLCCALKIREKYKKSDRFKYIKTSLTISLGSTIATSPLCSALFGKISLIGVFVNIIVIPLATMLLGSIIIFFTFALILPQQIMEIFAIIPDILASLIIYVAHTVSKLKFASIEIQLYQTIGIIGSLSAILMIITGIIKKKFQYVAIALVLVVSIVGIIIPPKQKEVSVTFINCSKGESTLIKTPSGKNYMFDCGSSTFDDAFEDIFKSYLKHTRTNKIDTLYISYFDDEHVSAVNKMIVNGYINTIVIPPEAKIKSEKVIKNRMQITAMAKRYNIPVSCITDDVQSAEDGITISTVGDNFELDNKNACAVYKINYGKTSFVLSSCIGAKGQELLTDADNCTVLKTPNYGNKVKATNNYIMGFKPKYAVITAPQNDKYNTVNEEIINTLKTNNITTYRTDYNQTITFFTNGKDITSVKLKKG